MLKPWAIAAVAILSATVGAAQAVPDTPPDNSGPVKMLTASWLGGSDTKELIGTQIEKNGAIILASANAEFFLLSSDGRVLQGSIFPMNELHPTLLKMAQDARGDLFILADCPQGSDSPNATFGPGRIIMKMAPDFKIWDILIKEGQFVDFAVSPEGEVETLDKGKITRYAANGKTVRWTASFASHGDNRPGGLAIDPASGVTTVVGYGMSETGHEPYKDPYAYGFSRQGKPLWSLWNPDPKSEAGTQYGGDGLMADTTGLRAAATASGGLLLMLKADGGNSVCLRDPADPAKPLDPAVMAGAFQKSAGFGFHGASATSVIFRADARAGHLEHGTWMSAWLSPAHANALNMSDAAGDTQGDSFVVGDSAWGCPTKRPWYTAAEGGYQGGGFLAVFDPAFGLRQCGYFPGASLNTVACRNGTVVIAGSAGPNADHDGHADPIRLFHPVQSTFGGQSNGYFAVLRLP